MKSNADWEDGSQIITCIIAHAPVQVQNINLTHPDFIGPMY